MPYREPPQRVARRADDPASVTSAISSRDRFSRLAATSLWPAPSKRPFEAGTIRTMTVSGDGRVALIASGRQVWRLDTESMIADAPLTTPDSVTQCALDTDGSRALLLCGHTLFRWDLAAGSELVEVWTSPGLGHASVVRLSSDGRVAIAAHYRQQSMVRVIDVEAGTLTYSFRTDADEALVLHPEGRHIVSFGDDGIARVYGRLGPQAELKRTGGGAFSNDGKTLAINCLDRSHDIRLFPIDTTDPVLALIGVEDRLGLRAEVRRWDCKMRFSPSDRLLLVEDDSRRAQLVSLESSSSRVLETEMKRETAFDSTESIVLSPGVSGDAFGINADSVAIVSCEAGAVEHMLCATNRDSMLMAITAVGLYGCIESESRPIGEEASSPYERPALLPSILSRGMVSLERDDQLHLEEVRARAASWTPFLPELTTDISVRELMALNLGLVELTDEIVHRARAAIIADESPRFGSPQLHRAALEAAAAELSGLAAPAREQAFEEMIKRLRSLERSRTSTPDSLAAPRPRLDEDSERIIKLSELEPAAPPPTRSKPFETALAPVDDQRLSTFPVSLVVGTTTAVGLLVALVYFLVSM